MMRVRSDLWFGDTGSEQGPLFLLHITTKITRIEAPFASILSDAIDSAGYQRCLASASLKRRRVLLCWVQAYSCRNKCADHLKIVYV